MIYKVFVHENGEPVEKGIRNNHDDALSLLMDQFRGRIEGLRPIHTGEGDYDLYDVFTSNGTSVAAIEWD